MGQVNLGKMRVVGNWFTSGGMEQYVNDLFKNKAAEVFKAGELVQIDGTPEILRVAAANLVGAGNDKVDVSDLQGAANTAAKLFGIALKDAPASGQVLIPVAILTPGVLVEANLVDLADGDTADTTGKHTSVAADKNIQVGILFDDTNDRYYFTVQAAEKCAKVVKIGFGVGGGGTQDPFGAIGDINVRAQCIINPDILWHSGESA